MSHGTLVCLALLALYVGLLCVIPGQGEAAEGGGGDSAVVAWYRFEAREALGADASGHRQDAKVTEGRAADGRVGGGLALDGRGGLELPSSDLLHAGQGFTFECWVRFANVTENMNVVSKDGEYLLRVDPPGEGGQISFFVNAGGSLEPRVRTVAAEPDTWYHLVAVWDGAYAKLWVNGQRFQVRRGGQVEPADSPVQIGTPARWGPVGLKGVLDEVRLHNRGLGDGEVLVAEYGLVPSATGPQATEGRFEFARDAQAWEGRNASELSVRDGALCARLEGPGAVLVNRSLDIPLAGTRFVAIRMAVSKGSEAKLLFLTSEGAGLVAFDILADGEMHSYVVRASDEAEWSGRLRTLGLAPSDEQAEAEVDFVRIGGEVEAPAEIAVKSLLPDAALIRAERPCRIVAALHNTGGAAEGLRAVLRAPRGVRIVGAAEETLARLGYDEKAEVFWQVQAEEATAGTGRLTIRDGDRVAARASLELGFAPAVDLPRADYVPEPQIAATGKYLVGAHYCPLWKQGSRSGVWELIVPYPERKPALGWYDEDNPEVTDWEIKWALEHGISFFVYCWYRANQGQAVEMHLSHAIHDGLFHSRYGDRFKFCIMWENQSKGHAGVASEEDLLQNLLPFWIENYFKHPSYLKVDNKPLLFVYRPEFLVDDLGSVEKVRSALDKVRQACREAGFDGLTILGEYRGTNPAPLELMREEGLDYSFAYCWPVGGHPSPEEAIRAQEGYWRQRREMAVLPDLLTVSMGWDSTPWHPSFSIWRLPPRDFRTACERARGFMDSLPEDELGRRLVLLDNWNEFGEGHYIAPHRQYGFGYLDAVRSVFSDAPETHVDLVPEDVGLGPYEEGYRRFVAQVEACSKKVVAEGGLEPGLLAWWTFDEDEGEPVALDYSGHGLGGSVDKATRVPGYRGRALACTGGSVNVPPGEPRFGVEQMTVECWVRTDTPDQSDRWLVNTIRGQGDSGFRLGLSQGRLCWAVPKTSWSHHLQAGEPLPLGKWVHVAGTYDGQTMRVYMEGREVGSLARGGRVLPNGHALTLGSYDRDHRAFFSGLLDEVRIYSRALTAEEIAQRARQ